MNEGENEQQNLERHSKNGRQVGSENAERLRTYLAELKMAGGCLPSSKGKLDKSAIAVACGFNRQTLYNNPEAMAVLNKAVEEIGLDPRANVVVNGKDAHLQQQMDKRDRRIRYLEENLQARIAEIEGLKQENKELRERLRQCTIMEEVMTTNGRRFRP